MSARPRGSSRLATLLIVSLAGHGCRWLRPERSVDPLAAPLQQADQAWRDRGANGLQPVHTLLDPLLAAAPTDSRVLWRMSRLSWLRGFLATDPSEARTSWESGREYALTCLLTDPEVAAGFRENGWLLADPALAAASPAQRPCLLWAAASGLALVESRGAGGALDAQAACAMVERASDLVGPSEPGLVEWEVGTCAWWLTADRAVAMAAWREAVESGNPIYSLAPDAHEPGVEHAATPNPAYALENARLQPPAGTP